MKARAMQLRRQLFCRSRFTPIILWRRIALQGLRLVACRCPGGENEALPVVYRQRAACHAYVSGAVRKEGSDNTVLSISFRTIIINPGGCVRRLV